MKRYMEQAQANKDRAVTIEAPGRINLIGEHTDYNEGFVMPAAIGNKMRVTMRLNGTESMVNVKDCKHNESITFDLKSMRRSELGWPNYIIGVVEELQKLGADLKGFDAEFESNIPIGSGMSSSAALECGFAFASNELFELGFDKWQLIKAAQMAEHNFVGNKCGIMDQFASVMGRRGHAMLLDCRNHTYEYLPLNLGDYQLLLLNTNVTHSLASSEYNIRRAECEEGVAILKKSQPTITALRDVDIEMLVENKDKFPEHIFRRCRHVISENKQVLEAAKALQRQDLQTLGQLMYQSHFSLQNDYEVSCSELDFLVQQAADKEYVLGSRMMGGGFGGCTINLIESSRVEEFMSVVSADYRMEYGKEPTSYIVKISDGAGVV